MNNSARTFILIINFAFLSILTACGGGGNNSLPPAPDKSEFKILTLIFEGAGSGSITFTPTKTVCKTDCTEKFTTGTKVTLSAIEQTGSVFNGFKGDAGCVNNTVTMSTAVNCIATFSLNPDITVYELSISVTGNGSGSVISIPLDSLGINCGLNCNKFYKKDDVVTLRAKPTIKNIFTGWNTGCGVSSGTKSLETTITMTNAQMCTANFEPEPTAVLYKLNVILAGTGKTNGLVVSNPSGINCDSSGNTCFKDFVENLPIKLTTKVTNVNTVFKSWSGDCGNGTNPVVNITMSTTTSCTATFNLIPKKTFDLNISISGSGVVSVDRAGIPCAGKANCYQYTTGTTAQLNAQASLNYAFTGWTGTGCIASNGNTATVLMDAARSCQATFTRTYNLYVKVADNSTGTGSIIFPFNSAVSSCGLTCNVYLSGEIITLTQKAGQNSMFTGWTGPGCVSSIGNTARVFMDSPRICQAIFTLTKNLTIKIDPNSTGTGTINFTSGTPAAKCGTLCNSYGSGDIVTITAQETGQLSIFAGWSGSGCVATDNIATVITNSATTCTALFKKIPSVTHTVTLGANYQITRSGITGESISWVIEKDGEVVLTRNATNELSYTYFSNTAGSTFRIWLEDFIIGTGNVRISNIGYYSIKPSSYNLWVTIVGAGTANTDSAKSCGLNCWSYTEGVSANLTAISDSNSTFSWWSGNGCTATGTNTANVLMNTTAECTATFSNKITPTHIIALNPSDYQIYRNGSLGENLLWVVEKDGLIVLESNATNDLSFFYTANAAGSHYRVWINKFNGNTYVRDSNVILYSIPLNFNLSSEIIGIGTVSSDSSVSCGANCWVYPNRTNATLTASTDANSTFTGWTGTGCTVTGPSDTTATVMMNTAGICTATFTSTANLTHTITLGANNKIFRSGNLGDATLVWVIEKNGTTALKRAANNELSYTYFSNSAGSNFRVWLEQTINAQPVVVSNIIMYSMP